MDGAQITALASQTFMLVLTGSAPTMLAAAIAGLLISILQALTQVQDQGLPTAVKFFAVLAVLFFTYQSLSDSLVVFGDAIFNRIAQL